ncbi:MAG TPA: malate/lactate/ureidoglycolate dehydrogenase [Myxococcales bacterium]|nr:malate/lactate/ureidoglycolate dehydrogenase [Myxococcales bacterium]
MTDREISTAALRNWTVALWRAAGSNEREAALAAEHLIGANLAGHDSHGIGMVPRYIKSLLANELQLNQTVQVVTESGSLLVVDGQRGLGQSVAHQAMALAIERARRDGVCILGLRNAHHIGRIGHWAEQAAAAGLVSIHFTNAVAAQAMVAPHGGAEGRFLTNPFTVAIPRAGEQPVLLDFATSAIAQGKVRVAYNRKEKLPADFLIDAQGKPSNDPAVMFEPEGGPHGALVTSAGHKGYALAMVCELLGAALIGGETTRPAHQVLKHAIWNNMLAIVFDPARLGTSQAFESEARAFIEWVKSARTTSEILMPGDPERRMRKARAAKVPIDDGTLRQLDEAARDVQKINGQFPGLCSVLQ